MSGTQTDDEIPKAVVAPGVPAEATPQVAPRTEPNEPPLIDPADAAAIELIEIGEVAPTTRPKPATEDQPQESQPEEKQDTPFRGLRPRTADRILAATAIAVSVIQAPGQIFTDSRSDLTSNPGLFLSRVVDVWSSTYDFGHVQSGQFVGYLFPMAPFYAGGAALGVPMWIVQRAWLALILLAAAIGVSKLVGALWQRDDGFARVVAGLVFLLNPYVVTQVNRGTVSLLAYAVLPWLMYSAHRALLEPRSWRWPVAAGALVAAGGGGVNAAVLIWVILAPLTLIGYEIAIIGRSARAAWSALWRTGACVAGLSLWWVIPVGLQSKFGADFLSFTEQPSTIWATNSVSESLRLLGYWISYFQIGFGASRPVVPPTTIYLFMPLLVAGSFAVPVMAFSFLPAVWRRAYIPYFVLLAVGATIAMSVGFPPGKPLNRLLVDAYYSVPLLQILRTTYKAAPLLALALAVLVGAGGAETVRRLRSGNNRRLAAAGLVLAPIVFGWPLVTGTALDSALTYKDVPSYWRQAAADIDAKTAPGHRALILPGQQFGVYRWGTTFDPIAPAITRSPVAQRYSVRYSDAHSSQLISAVDNLVQQRRQVPGQLPSLLSLLGVQQLLVAADGIPEYSGEIDPASAQEVFSQIKETQRPTATYGPTLDVAPAVGRSGKTVSLPAIRRFELSANRGAETGIVRAHPRRGTTVVSGDASGIVELAAHGLLPKNGAILFSGDQTGGQIRRLIKGGASVVITDTNRRQSVLATRTSHDQGAVLSARDVIAPEVPSYGVFSGAGHSKQSLAAYTGISYVTNPEGPQLLLRPEARPYAAVDGDLKTTWTPANFLPEKRWIEIGLRRRTRVGSIRVHPHRDSLVQTVAIGVSVDGSPERKVVLLPGWTDVAVGQAPIRKVRIRILRTSTFGGIDLGGIDEISFPGIEAREWMRTPVYTAQTLAGQDLRSTPINILLARQSTSDPYRSSGAYGGPVPTGDPKATFDAEVGMRRIVSLPAARSFTASGWASSAPWTPDWRFDQIAGLAKGWRINGSPRHEGVPANRSSSALDGNPRTTWAVETRAGVKPWITWHSPKPVRMSRLQFVYSDPIFRRPAQVIVSFGGLSTDALPVGKDGTVVLPRAITTRDVRIDFIKTLSPTGAAAYRLLPAMALQDIRIAGFKIPRIRHSGQFKTRCGELSISTADSSIRAFVAGNLKNLDNARPLRFSSCGTERRLSLNGGPNAITVPPGQVMRIDHLALASKAPRPSASTRTQASVVSTTPDARGFTAVSYSGPGWLVHAESFSAGWTATCGPTRESQKDLGPPRVIDAFAAGWPVDSSCRFAKFTFAPQAQATNSYLASAGATGVFALVLLGSMMTRRRRRLAGAPAPIEPVLPLAPGDDRLAHARRQFAATAPLIAGGIAAALFALRVGPPVALIALFLGLWGVNVRRLYRAAAAALILVPMGYVALIPKNKGGGNFYYAVEQIMTHWIATIAILLAASGAGLTALRIRWSTHPRAGRWSIRRIRRELRFNRVRKRDADESHSSTRATHEPPEPD